MENLEKAHKLQQIRSEKINRRARLLHAGSFTLVSIFILIAISLPESILNKKITEETMINNRIELLIKILDVKDNEIRAELIKNLQNYYPEVNSYFKEIDQTVYQQNIQECKQKIKEYQKRLENCIGCSEEEKLNLRLSIELYQDKLRKIQK